MDLIRTFLYMCITVHCTLFIFVSFKSPSSFTLQKSYLSHASALYNIDKKKHLTFLKGLDSAYER